MAEIASLDSAWSNFKASSGGLIVALFRFMQVVLDRRINDLTGTIIAAAIKIHRSLGPGLLESVYLTCMVFELRRGGTRIEVQKKVPVHYDDVTLDCGYKIDIVAEELVVVELKSVRRLAPIHVAQMLTYLKLTGYPVGLLINFNVRLLKHGVRRLVNAHPAAGFLEPQKDVLR